MAHENHVESNGSRGTSTIPSAPDATPTRSCPAQLSSTPEFHALVAGEVSALVRRSLEKAISSGGSSRAVDQEGSESTSAPHTPLVGDGTARIPCTPATERSPATEEAPLRSPPTAISASTTPDSATLPATQPRPRQLHYLADGTESEGLDGYSPYTVTVSQLPTPAAAPSVAQVLDLSRVECETEQQQPVATAAEAREQHGQDQQQHGQLLPEQQHGHQLLQSEEHHRLRDPYESEQPTPRRRSAPATPQPVATTTTTTSQSESEADAAAAVCAPQAVVAASARRAHLACEPSGGRCDAAAVAAAVAVAAMPTTPSPPTSAPAVAGVPSHAQEGRRRSLVRSRTEPLARSALMGFPLPPTSLEQHAPLPALPALRRSRRSRESHDELRLASSTSHEERRPAASAHHRQWRRSRESFEELSMGSARVDTPSPGPQDMMDPMYFAHSPSRSPPTLTCSPPRQSPPSSKRPSSRRLALLCRLRAGWCCWRRAVRAAHAVRARSVREQEVRLRLERSAARQAFLALLDNCLLRCADASTALDALRHFRSMYSKICLWRWRTACQYARGCHRSSSRAAAAGAGAVVDSDGSLPLPDPAAALEGSIVARRCATALHALAHYAALALMRRAHDRMVLRHLLRRTLRRWAVGGAWAAACSLAREQLSTLRRQSLLQHGLRAWTRRFVLMRAVSALSAAAGAFLAQLRRGALCDAWRRWPMRRLRAAWRIWAGHRLVEAWRRLCERAYSGGAAAMLQAAGLDVWRAGQLQWGLTRWRSASHLLCAGGAIEQSAAEAFARRAVAAALRALATAAAAHMEGRSRRLTAEAHLRGWCKASAVGRWLASCAASSHGAALQTAARRHGLRASIVRWRRWVDALRLVSLAIGFGQQAVLRGAASRALRQWAAHAAVHRTRRAAQSAGSDGSAVSTGSAGSGAADAADAATRQQGAMITRTAAAAPPSISPHSIPPHALAAAFAVSTALLAPGAFGCWAALAYHRRMVASQIALAEAHSRRPALSASLARWRLAGRRLVGRTWARSRIALKAWRARVRSARARAFRAVLDEARARHVARDEAAQLRKVAVRLARARGAATQLAALKQWSSAASVQAGISSAAWGVSRRRAAVACGRALGTLRAFALSARAQAELITTSPSTCLRRRFVSWRRLVSGGGAIGTDAVSSARPTRVLRRARHDASSRGAAAFRARRLAMGLWRLHAGSAARAAGAADSAAASAHWRRSARSAVVLALSARAAARRRHSQLAQKAAGHERWAAHARGWRQLAAIANRSRRARAALRLLGCQRLATCLEGWVAAARSRRDVRARLTVSEETFRRATSRRALLAALAALEACATARHRSRYRSSTAARMAYHSRSLLGAWRRLLDDGKRTVEASERLFGAMMHWRSRMRRAAWRLWRKAALRRRALVGARRAAMAAAASAARASAARRALSRWKQWLAARRMAREQEQAAAEKAAEAAATAAQAEAAARAAAQAQAQAEEAAAAKAAAQQAAQAAEEEAARARARAEAAEERARVAEAVAEQRAAALQTAAEERAAASDASARAEALAVAERRRAVEEAVEKERRAAAAAVAAAAAEREQCVAAAERSLDAERAQRGALVEEARREAEAALTAVRRQMADAVEAERLAVAKASQRAETSQAEATRQAARAAAASEEATAARRAAEAAQAASKQATRAAHEAQAAREEQAAQAALLAAELRVAEGAVVAAELETERLRLSLSATPVRTWQQQATPPASQQQATQAQQQATQAQQQGTTPASQQATPAAAPPRLTETMSTPQTTPGAPPCSWSSVDAADGGGMVPNDEQDTVSPAEESPAAVATTPPLSLPPASDGRQFEDEAEAEGEEEKAEEEKAEEEEAEEEAEAEEAEERGGDAPPVAAPDLYRLETWDTTGEAAAELAAGVAVARMLVPPRIRRTQKACVRVQRAWRKRARAASAPARPATAAVAGLSEVGEESVEEGAQQEAGVQESVEEGAQQEEEGEANSVGLAESASALAAKGMASAGSWLSRATATLSSAAALTAGIAPITPMLSRGPQKAEDADGWTGGHGGLTAPSVASSLAPLMPPHPLGTPVDPYASSQRDADSYASGAATPLSESEQQETLADLDELFGAVRKSLPPISPPPVADPFASVATAGRQERLAPVASCANGGGAAIGVSAEMIDLRDISRLEDDATAVGVPLAWLHVDGNAPPKWTPSAAFRPPKLTDAELVRRARRRLAMAEEPLAPERQVRMEDVRGDQKNEEDGDDESEDLLGRIYFLRTKLFGRRLLRAWSVWRASGKVATAR